MVTLKNCPFCGGAAGYSRIPGSGFSVLCKRCGAIGVLGHSSARDDVGNMWNLRIPAKPNFSRQDNVKPCPFCGSRAFLGKMADSSDILKCERCGMLVSFAQSRGLSDTLELWNRRVQG